jgi:transposase
MPPYSVVPYRSPFTASKAALGFAPSCKTGNARVRKALYMPAMVALRFNPTLRTFAERLVAAGKHKQLVNGAVRRSFRC